MDNFSKYIAEQVDIKLSKERAEKDLYKDELEEIRSALGTQRRNRSVPAIQKMQEELAKKDAVLQRMCATTGTDNYGNLEKAVEAKFRLTQFHFDAKWDLLPSAAFIEEHSLDNPLKWVKDIKKIVKVYATNFEITDPKPGSGQEFIDRAWGWRELGSYEMFVSVIAEYYEEYEAKCAAEVASHEAIELNIAAEVPSELAPTHFAIN